MTSSALLIANPTAGFDRSVDRAGLAARTLGRLGLEVEIYRTQGPRDAERAAREASRQFDLVIAAGGDGTLHEVANGLAGSPTPLGLIPLGSMNILARELGMPLDVEGACAWITRARPESVSLGFREASAGTGGEERDKGRYFVIMAGIGYDAFALEAALARAEAARRKVRFSDYVLASTFDARRYSFPTLVLESGDWSETGSFAFLANCARYGGNLRIARLARVEEPLIDLVLFKSGQFWDRLRFFAAVLAGRPERTDGILYKKVESVTIRVRDQVRVPVQLDGERSSPLPATFRVVPNALRLLRSAEAA